MRPRNKGDFYDKPNSYTFLNLRPARLRPARARPARVRPARARPARVRPARVRPARVRLPSKRPNATEAQTLPEAQKHHNRKNEFAIEISS